MLVKMHSLNYIDIYRVVFLLVYSSIIVSITYGLPQYNVRGASQEETLRTRPRQARLALQELNLIPAPDEEQRDNDKFLKDFPRVTIIQNFFLIFVSYKIN